MARVVVGEGLNAAGDAEGGVTGLFGNIDTDHDCVRHVPLLPPLQIRSWVKQRFGLQRNGHDGAPSAHTRACRPRGETGCAAAPERTDAEDVWTAGYAGSRRTAPARFLNIHIHASRYKGTSCRPPGDTCCSMTRCWT